MPCFLPWQQILISQPKIKIMSRNLQDLILGVYQGHPCHQGWPCPPSLPSGTLKVLQVPSCSWPPIPDTLLIEISAQHFQSIILGVKKHHSWRQEWPCHPCLQSGTLNVLQVPPFLTHPFWHTSNWDISSKFSGSFPLSLPKSSVDHTVIGLKAQKMGQRTIHQPSPGARMKGPKSPDILVI